MKNGTGNGKVTAEKQHKGKIKDPQKAIAAKAAELAALLDFSDIMLGDQVLLGHQIYRPETYYHDEQGVERQGTTDSPFLDKTYRNKIVSQLTAIAEGQNGESDLNENNGYIQLLHHLKLHIGENMIDMAKVHFDLSPSEENHLHNQACCGNLHFNLLSLASLGTTSPKRFGEAKAFQEKVDIAYDRVKFLISKDGLHAYEQVRKNDANLEMNDWPYFL